MLKKLGLGIIFAAVLLSLTIAIAPARASAHGGHGDQGRARGPITAIDLTKSTLTVNDRNNGPVTVMVNSATDIRKDDKKNATLADLAVGDNADVRFDPATMIATRIRDKSAQVAQVEGTISAMDTGAMMVTIMPEEGGMSVTLNVTSATQIERDEMKITLADLHVGDRVEAKYNPLNMNAIKIEAN